MICLAMLLVCAKGSGVTTAAIKWRCRGSS
jgi:hypothetical protein